MTFGASPRTIVEEGLDARPRTRRIRTNRLSPLVRGPLSFRPISLLFVLMAISVGAFALSTVPMGFGLGLPVQQIRCAAHHERRYLVHHALLDRAWILTGSNALDHVIATDQFAIECQVQFAGIESFDCRS